MTFNILVVCAANVCRSPLAAAILTDRLASVGPLHRVRVTSRGANAVAGVDCCTEIVNAARRSGIDAELLESHRSHTLQAEWVESADLVLTADRETRSCVVRLCHAAHPRTFTLREAAELGSLLPARGAEVRRTSAHLSAFVEELNGFRGLTELPRVDRRRSASRPWRRIPVHSHDIPDAHQGEAGMHGLALGLVVSSAEQVGGALVSWAHAGATRDAVE